MDYALFVALAIIDMEKDVLQNPKFDFSDIIEVSYPCAVYRKVMHLCLSVCVS